ncbi:MAG: neutral/alkaline non-lysosomal ceramidase N-terminal domain-containing protein [Mariniphaga sp.]|nr:neutral/alkaline non-lysosomal ceramidase N-terminal domain-containing protein [Mariniphaga sp.]MDD4227052.1 neutral/alkaline non-lysosomal ceramidase N-terminal domain-containing protein [Mariniphaga sp.]
MKRESLNPGQRTVLLLAFFFISQISLATAPEGIFQAGAAKIKITPETPIPMSGYGGRNDPFKGVREDIYARAVVVSDGMNKAAIISAEVIGFSHSFWEDCSQLITKETGIPAENIFLAAVHSHSGPVTSVYSKEVTPEITAYVKELKTNLAEATRAAVENLAPASIGAGKGECLMNINRRAPDGKGGIALGRNPYGPCDHEVGVVRIDDTSGKPIAVMVSWPCHGVVLGPKNKYITGDWPGSASRYLEEHFGDGIVVPMIIGASGDINPIYGPHIDYEITSSYSFGKEAIGEILGKETIRVFDEIHTISKGKISASQQEIFLPAKDQEGSFQQPESVRDNTLKVRLSALKIGGIILTGVSGEVFNEISVQMRKQSPYSHTFMVTHCNGSSGYLVTDEAYKIGGYEANSTRAKSGAEEGIINNLLEMINQL